MSVVVDTILIVLALATLLPSSLLLVQVVMALPNYRQRELLPGERPAIAVVIPAHDEALVIEQTLRSIVPQLTANDRLLVVADNCSDNTAAIAGKAGAAVIERTDHERRGKGYAVDFAIRHLRQMPPEVVIIIDADCQASTGSIDRLARLSVQTGRPVQALDLMRAPAGASLKTRLAEFAWLLKNQIRPLGYHVLRMPCQLMGTGMAFPWAVISTAPVASGSLVEDMLLGLDLTRAGRPPLFCAEAVVISLFPHAGEALASQRRRWEHGHLGLILRSAPRLFVEAVSRANWQLFALLLDLCVPPLTLLLFLIIAVLAVSAVASWTFGASILPAWLACASLAMLTAAVLISWARYGRSTIRLSDLAYAPCYAVAKIPLYLKFLMQRQVDWVRSRRDKD